MAFSDVAAKLLEGVENIGDVNDYVKLLNDEHAKDVAEKESVYQTKIDSQIADLAARDEKIKDLKLTNYDLIQSKPVTVEPGTDNPGGNAPTEKGISSLFKTKD